MHARLFRTRSTELTPRLALLVSGTATLGAGMVVVRDGRVPAPERTVFRLVNDLPDALYPALWPVFQLGALVVAPVLAAAALITRRPRLALAVAVVTALKLAGERVVKLAVSRQRPGSSIGPDIHARGDVHLSGESFVSGHVALATALAVVVAPYLTGRWRLVPFALAGGVAVGRVYVGAHNPLDVVCGAALGVLIGVVADALTRRPHGEVAR
jgi:glycosyltransferase 2 family protein